MSESEAKFCITLGNGQLHSARIEGTTYALSMLFFELFCESPASTEFIELALKAYQLKVEEESK
jgi:hypothetical protein